MKKILAGCLLLFACFQKGVSQNVGIGTNSPHASAQLDVSSTSKGVLLPRMTTAQRNAIAGPEPGLLVFDTDKRSLYIYDGMKWAPVYIKSDGQTDPIELPASDGSDNDQFGYAVAISGDYAVAGAYMDDVGANADQGSAYIFHRVNGVWTEEAHVTASDGAAGDGFGFSVSISGDYVIVGSPYDDVSLLADKGSAYVFYRTGNTWSQQIKLTAADGAANDNYGFAVTMYATTAAVSAPSDDIGANTDQGSVYIYQLTGSVWSLDTKYLATDGTAINKFGYSICMNGAFLIIGSPGVDAAYIIWKLVVWQLVQKLVGSSGTTYGRAVTIFGNYAAVAYTLSGFGGMAGIVKLYFRGALGVWNLQATLNDPYPYVNQIFGRSLSMGSDDLVIGAVPPEDFFYGHDSSYVAVFHRTGTNWSLDRVIIDPTRQTFEQYGNSVAISGYNVIIGIPWKRTKKGDIAFINIE